MKAFDGFLSNTGTTVLRYYYTEQCYMKNAQDS